MKWQTYKERQTENSKPFLVLPLLKVNAPDTNVNNEMTKKKPNLKLFTKTWPPKRNENRGKNKTEDRPLTATLEKPQILDIKFMGKIDMSLMRKEFLCITNLCRAPISITKVCKKPTVSNRRRSVTNRPLSLPSCDGRLSVSRRAKRPETSEDSWEDEESCVSQAQSAKNIKVTKTNSKKITPATHLTAKRQTMKRLEKKTTNDPNNNLKLSKIVRQKGGENNNTPAEGKKNPLQSTKLPEPCKTCGRPDQPERFHSHPVTPLKPARKMEEIVKIPVKSTVQKPVAIKFKSRQSEKPAPLKKSPSPLPAQHIVHSPLRGGDNRGQVQGDRPRTGRGPRTLMCYLCGREFGTASLPLHEPKCLEKWERENASLPPNLRRKLPKKPDTPMTAEKWNEYAWEACQASLAPCEKCGRTFLPDRLVVHQRSCKAQNGMVVFKKGEAHRKKKVYLIMILAMLIIGPIHGEMNVLYLYTRYKFHWSEVDFSIFFTYSCIAHLMGCTFALALFSKYLKLDDAMLGLISSVSKICGCIVYAFAPNSMVFYVGTLIEVFNGTAFIAMRSIISKLVAGDELGKMNSMFGMSEALMPLIYGPMYSALYKNTIKVFPGSFFLLGGVLTTPAVAIFVWLYLHRIIETKEEPEGTKEILLANYTKVEKKNNM